MNAKLVYALVWVLSDTGAVYPLADSYYPDLRECLAAGDAVGLVDDITEGKLVASRIPGEPRCLPKLLYYPEKVTILPPGVALKVTGEAMDDALKALERR